MNVKQFMLFLFVEKTGVKGENEKYSYSQCLQVDLVNGDIPAFLESIPDDLNAHSQVWITISTMDGNNFSYVDGMESDTAEGSNGVEYHQINSERREDLRKNATIWANRHLQRKNSDEQNR